ncbi:MAG TPA: ATP-binding protein, partial [Novosphingobium sp.]
ADDLNAYIDHTGATVERARIEAGNLAHSLRTPLAVITDEAERLARQPASRASAEVLLAEAQRMGQQIEFRLARARSAASGSLPGTVCRIDAVLAPILSAMRRLHPDIAFTLAAGPGDAELAIDPADLTELLSNLLDNAGKWAAERVVVTVAAGPAPAIAITDDGPGLSAEQIARAGQAGLRFDASRPGSGLGLAIARDIAQNYGLVLGLAPRGDGASGLVATLAARPG